METMHNIEFSQYTLDDAKEMAEQIRDMDRIEVVLISGQPVYAALRQIYFSSDEAITARYKGQLLCVFGRINLSLLSGDCNIWMVATDIVENNSDAKRSFLRVSRKAIRDLIGSFEEAWNIVYEKNKRTIRWLKWCGFEFFDKPIYIKNEVFFKFRMKGVVNVS